MSCRLASSIQNKRLTLLSSRLCPSCTLACACTLARARCPTRDVATECFFLIIHNPRISHPNNLKFWKKLLCTYMSNFLTGSFLYVKLPSILSVGKVRKTRTTAHINFYSISNKQSNIQIAQSILMALVVFCPWVLKISNYFIPFSPRNGELNVKKSPECYVIF